MASVGPMNLDREREGSSVLARLFVIYFVILLIVLFKASSISDFVFVHLLP